MLRVPDLDSVCQVGSHNSRANLLVTLLFTQSRIKLAFWAAITHCQLRSDFLSTVSRSLQGCCLSPFISLSVLMPEIAPPQVQDSTGLHEVHSGPLLKPSKAPMDGILSLKQTNSTTQLFIIHKLAEVTIPLSVIVAGVCLFILLKNRYEVSLFQSLKTSPDCHDFLNMMESSLATISAI